MRMIVGRPHGTSGEQTLSMSDCQSLFSVLIGHIEQRFPNAPFLCDGASSERDRA